MKIKTANDMQKFLRGVFCGRPGDKYPRINHANGVNETVVLTLASAVMTVADLDSIVVNERLGRIANMTWFTVRGQRHALVYRPGAVHLHQRSRWGIEIAAFTHKNIDRIWPVFSTL
jgi:hypothetical protein